MCRAAMQFRDILEPRGPYEGGLAKDVSAGGLRFETAQFFSHQRRLIIQLLLPGLDAPIRSVMQVVWTCKHAHSDQYEIGAQFVEMASQDRNLVASYVERGVRAVPMRAA